MSMSDKNHYNTVISLQLIKINEKQNSQVKSKYAKFWKRGPAAEDFNESYKPQRSKAGNLLQRQSQQSLIWNNKAGS